MRQPVHPHTEILNKSQKNKSKKSRYEALSWLVSQFPQLFDNKLRIRPLKIGIMNDILAHADKAAKAGISKAKLREAVVMFTRRIDYLACLKAREMRVNLEGEPVEKVTEEEAEKAAAKIKRRIEKRIRNTAQKWLDTPSLKPSAPTYQAASPLAYYSNRLSDDDIGSSDVKHTSHKAPVIVKHRTPRPFDPNAVARLKERLTLTRQVQKEMEHDD